MKTFYVKTFPKIWQTERFMSMTLHGMLITKYLYECPHGNLIGFFLLDEHFILADMNAFRKRWTLDQVRSSLRESAAHEWICFDRKSRTVLLVDWFEVNPIQNTNIAKAAVKQLSRIPSKSPFFIAFRGLVEQYGKQFYEPLVEVFKQFPERYQEG